MRKRVTIVGGGGAVGATAAQRIIDRGLADVVLADVLEGIPAGRALDMLESTPILGSDVNAIGSLRETATTARPPTATSSWLRPGSRESPA